MAKARGSINPEYLEIRVVGAPSGVAAAAETVTLNGREWHQALGRPLLVTPGVVRVTVPGFGERKVRIRNGETDHDYPKVVELHYPRDAVAGV